MVVDRKESEAQNDFISIFFDFLRYSLFSSLFGLFLSLSPCLFRFLHFHFIFYSALPFTFTQTAPMSILRLYGYLLFALKQKPLHRYVAMPFDVSYAKRYAVQMASKQGEIDERVKIKYTKAKRQRHTEQRARGRGRSRKIHVASNNTEIENDRVAEEQK